jgi:uncharacterized protein
VPGSFHVLVKPTGAICNLDCAYCFFLEKEHLYPGSTFRMDDDVLEAYLRQVIDGDASDRVTVAWQGGEPTLAPKEFYRRAAQMAADLLPPGKTIEWSMQTNGTRLDDEWCDLFLEHGYLVGLSLDGPRAMHDAHRVDKRGEPTFDRVMEAAALLRRRGVEFNVLTTVNAANGDHGREVYRFLRDEVGARYLQFIPIVERVGPDGRTGMQVGTEVTDRSVTGEQWGRFLVEVFEDWVRHDVGDVFVMLFDWTLASWLGLDNPACIFRPTCGDAVALEHNGDLYSCDHFVEPEYLLGNLMEASIGELVASERQREFGRKKLDTLPQYCLDCEVRFACNGECPKNRFTRTPDGEEGLNYLCAGYKAFFTHVDAPMRAMAGLLREGRPASDVMAMPGGFAPVGRNDPCPCGSGAKYKVCHAKITRTG